MYKKFCNNLIFINGYSQESFFSLNNIKINEISNRVYIKFVHSKISNFHQLFHSLNPRR